MEEVYTLRISDKFPNGKQFFNAILKIGIVLPADLVIHGSGRWSLTLHCSTLVWQPPIDEPRTVKHGVLSWERLRSTSDKPQCWTSSFEMRVYNMHPNSKL